MALWNGVINMDSVKDLRLNEDIFKRMIGKQFYKYKCDPFVFTNTVTGIVGLYWYYVKKKDS